MNGEMPANEAEAVAAEPAPHQAYNDDQDPAVDERWSIKDLPSADWALSRIADFEREAAENKAVAEANIARTKLRLELLNARLEHGAAFFRGKLREFAETNRAELLGGGRKKSRSLEHGSIGWRKSKSGLEVKDAEALLAWARAQPVELDLVRTTEAPALVAIKERFEGTGEVPDGCEVKPETEELFIKAESGGVNGSH